MYWEAYKSSYKRERGSRTSSAAHAKLAAEYQRSRGQAGSSARARSQLTEGRDMNPLFQDGPSSYAAPPPPPQRVEQASPLTDRIRPASDAPQYDSGGQPARKMTLAREHGVFGGGSDPKIIISGYARNSNLGSDPPPNTKKSFFLPFRGSPPSRKHLFSSE